MFVQVQILGFPTLLFLHNVRLHFSYPEFPDDWMKFYILYTKSWQQTLAVHP